MYRLLLKSPQPPCVLRFINQENVQKERETLSTAQAQWVKDHHFKTDWGSVCEIPEPDGQCTSVWIGCDKQPADPRCWIQLFSKLARSLTPRCYALPVDFPAQREALLGWGLGSYQFNRYQQSKASEHPTLQHSDDAQLKAVEVELDAIFLARDLINTPANHLGPQDLADQVQNIAEKHGATCSLIAGETLLSQNYPAIHAVGKGSERAPLLIDLRWGRPDAPKLTLVGKGVVFDSGGLDIKSAAGMALMKKDMGGAAVSIALARYIMEVGLDVRLRLLVPAVENAVSGRAYRPGDVLATRKGLSVEIGNTDAEGRVILCDALTEAASESPDLIIDFATLTGACRVALGPDLPGFWTPDDSLAEALNRASAEVSDPVWRMPLWAPYRSYLKSAIADINNNSNSPHGGAITAALYLHEFVKPFSAWIHIDMFGWNVMDQPENAQMAEATSLRAVFRMLQNRYPSAK
ncbi:MAG: leucyl aminopeptidase family protein [Acidobacteria bacterium]|nr:leucyl aminopeptidase family protein [Acidobacteriota bacterium]